jgi:hypothetical protein
MKDGHKDAPYSKNYEEYVKAYENLQTTFNPVRFAPEIWVKAAKCGHEIHDLHHQTS